MPNEDPQTQKATLISERGLYFYAGDDLLSHTLSRAVQSALRGLTSVFGMGTGGPPRYDHRQTCCRWSLAVGRWLFLPTQTALPMLTANFQRARERSLTAE